MIKAAKYAQQQRADIVEKLESHFTGVMTFGRHLEMAHAVSTRWPNVETAGVLASAALAIPSELTKVADRHESVDDCSYPGTRSVDYGEHPVEARERVDYVKVIDSVSTSAPPWTRDQMQPMPVLHPASTPAPASLPIATPIRLLGGDRAGTQQQHSSQDDMVLLLSELKSVWHPAPTPAPLSLPIVGAVPSPPAKGARSLRSMILGICATGGPIALVAWTMTYRSTPHFRGPVPASLISVNRDRDTLHAAAAAPPSVPTQQAEVSMQTLEPASAALPPSPQSQPSQAASVRAGTAPAPPLPSPQSQPSQVASVRAGTASATLPPSPQSQPSQAASVRAGTAPATPPPSLQSQPSQVASLRAGTASETLPPSPKSQPSQEVASLRAGTASETPPPSPPSQPSQAASVRAGTAPATLPPSPQSQPSQAASVRTGTEPATPPPSPQSQPSQAASVRTGTEPATPPPSSQSQSSQAASVRTGPASATLPASPQSRPSQVASIRAGPAPATPPPSPQSQPSTATRLDAEQIAEFVNRGIDLLKSGDFASARLLFRRAAEAGSANAALMLGATFDPLDLPQFRATGIEPDVAQARRWYEKAAELGSDTASQQLADLAQIRK